MAKTKVTFAIDGKLVQAAMREAALESVRQQIKAQGRRAWHEREIAPGVQRAPKTSEG